MSGSLLGLLPADSLRQLCQFSNEHMTLALAGQFKQLSHEPEKLRAGQFVGLMFSRERNVV